MQQGDLHREVIKLLVQVAWADQEVADAERSHIVGVARSAGLSDDEISEIERALSDQGTLEAPDFELLKRFRQDVKRAAMVLIRTDGHIADGEADVLASIDKLLAD